MLENKFRDSSVVPFLKEYQEDIYFFIKEAKSIRGIPDIICCVNGLFVALELKRKKSEAFKNSGSVVFQRYTMSKINDAGGFAFFVYPENFEAFKKDFIKLIKISRRLKKSQFDL